MKQVSLALVVEGQESVRGRGMTPLLASVFACGFISVTYLSKINLTKGSKETAITVSCNPKKQEGWRSIKK